MTTMRHHLTKVTYETRTFIIDIACTIVVSVKKLPKWRTVSQYKYFNWTWSFTGSPYLIHIVFLVLKVILLDREMEWHIYNKPLSPRRLRQLIVISSP